MHMFLCRTDNYGCLVHDHKTGATASIDAPDAKAVEAELIRRGWQLTHVFTTHHHGDHTEGNLYLRDLYGCRILGPAAEAEKIPGLAKPLNPGEVFRFANRDVHVIATPGHTAGHIAYHIPEEYSLFAGDTLFTMGCGRVIEGTMAEMFASLERLKKLSPHTYVYSGHEYTLKNAAFGLSIEPGNRALSQRAEVVAKERAQGRFTVPSTLGEELKTNVFLRCDSPEIRTNLELLGAAPAEVFAEIRRRKDSF